MRTPQYITRSVNLRTLSAYRNGGGLGDTVNNCAAILPASHQEIEAIDPTQEMEHETARPAQETRTAANGPAATDASSPVAHAPEIGLARIAQALDIIRYKPRVRVVPSSEARDVTAKYAGAWKDPAMPTLMRFSDEELEAMRGILADAGCDESPERPERYLVICPNNPSETPRKRLDVGEWREFVRAYRKEERTIIITPTFTTEKDAYDHDIAGDLAEKLGVRVINLQDLLVRDAATRQRLAKLQQSDRFGLDRNDAGPNLRQDAAIYHLLLTRPLQGLFHDSAPVHIATAASGLGMVSGRCFQPEYAPHNDGAYWQCIHPY